MRIQRLKLAIGAGALILTMVPNSLWGAVVFGFSATCNLTAPFIVDGIDGGGDCVAFGLGPADLVVGTLTLSDLDGAAGASSQLTSNQYSLDVQFGNELFTQNDAIGLLGMLIDGTGDTVASISGSFTNGNGAALGLITPTTITIELNGDAADTFGEGGRWNLESVVIPIPASLGLFGSALGLLGWVRRRA